MSGPVKKAGIVVDDWKLPIFRKRLEEAGFAYTDAGGLTGSTTVLTVETAEVDRLAIVLAAAQAECARSRMQ